MALDKKTLGNAFNQIAYGEVMKAAARDYLKEIEDDEAASRAKITSQVDVDDLLDDPELEKLHADRIAAMKQEAEKRAELQRKGHGSYTEINEGEFLEVVTKSPSVVVHFFHKEFERCKIVDKHMDLLARKHLCTRFVKLSAPDSPFFTVKLGVKVLPAVVFFKEGVSVGRIVGFEGLGGKDDFGTAMMEGRLREAGLLATKAAGGRAAGGTYGGSYARGGAGGDDSSDDERGQQPGTSIRRSFHSHGTRQQGSDDESSDFED